MQVSRIGARGRTTIPKAVRQAAGLHEGDAIAFEVEDDRLLVHKVALGQGEYLQGVGATMAEWLSAEDEEAWRDL